MGPKRTPIATRLQRNSKAARNGCRIWTGNTLPRGYPIMGKGGHGGGTMYAHRAAFKLAYGAIPKGKQLHHTCGNVRCINPAHLVAMTHKQHKAIHLSATCPRGHEFTAENTYYRPDTGVRRCKQCTTKWMATYHKERNL